ncbi:hypothetical protein LEN26_008282 [Aphanomyces euteiches]|uniref:C2H2-type domain-containing protein n=1 Tax=Aphanomyces euteiches TaxID=100861 RepID=A0A6G0WYU9_9STRA|nr:hypothetical protein Ae201684_010266 [Aphanomyces euteiches]KAH9130698.1 hypothetical protein LEN26_008282 [Aphanomyces euteiches]KAH9143514.1 hypothetical protein AeRB84_012491 [Aphanomyces euteiches]KAH9185012.1 hypothetical protein AeNC1_013008 [Aphanomyces euteiches]
MMDKFTTPLAPFRPPQQHPPPTLHFDIRARSRASASGATGQVFEDDEQDILRHLLDIESTTTLEKGAAASSFAVPAHYRFQPSLPPLPAARAHVELPPIKGSARHDFHADEDAIPVELTKAVAVKKPHECAMCLKRFRAKSELITHERIHTGHKPFICMYEGCNKRFAHSSNLGAHHKAHQGIKPYMCTHEGCGKRYAHSGSLKEHVWKHYGVKPFKCSHPDCDRTFTQRSNYSRHMKKCHVQDSMATTAPEIKSELSYM